MTTTKAITLIAALALVMGAGAGVGCGDDGGGGGGAKPAAKKPVKKPAAKKSSKGKKAEELSFIPTLERTVPEGERKKIRRRLTDRDFVTTADGSGNRDPFRSFVLPLPGVAGGAGSLTSQPVVEGTDLCSQRNMVAPTHSVDNLSLIGIILRGARYYAMFRDTAGRGHIVDRTKCLGKEKAKVTEITEDFVTYAIIAEQIPGQPLRPAIEKTILLHPNELRPEQVLDEDLNPGVAPVEPPGVPPLDIAPPPPPPGPEPTP